MKGVFIFPRISKIVGNAQTFRHEKKACFVFVSCPRTQTRTLTLNTRNFRVLDTKHEHEKHEIFVFRHETRTRKTRNYRVQTRKKTRKTRKFRV